MPKIWRLTAVMLDEAMKAGAKAKDSVQAMLREPFIVQTRWANAQGRGRETRYYVEIISVFVILVILAAVAIPKYMDLQDSARTSAGQGAVSEIKWQLSNSYGKLMLLNAGSQPTVTAVFTGISTDVGTEFSVAAAVSGTTGVAITVGTVQGVGLTTSATGYWIMPTT